MLAREVAPLDILSGAKAKLASGAGKRFLDAITAWRPATLTR